MARPPANDTIFVLYDDGCPLCTFQMRILTWLDWFDTTTLLPISDSRAHDVAPGLAREDLLEAIHCLSRQRRIYRGARCIRFLGMRMPILIPLAVMLWVPGVIWVAEKVYGWISRHRHLLGRLFACKEACKLLPARQRPDESRVSGIPPKP